MKLRLLWIAYVVFAFLPACVFSRLRGPAAETPGPAEGERKGHAFMSFEDRTPEYRKHSWKQKCAKATLALSKGEECAGGRPGYRVEVRCQDLNLSTEERAVFAHQATLCPEGDPLVYGKEIETYGTRKTWFKLRLSRGEYVRDTEDYSGQTTHHLEIHFPGN